jgi:hypothetical protein
MLIKENALRKMIRSILLESPGMPDLNTKFKDIISSYQSDHPAIAKALEIVAQMVTGKIKFNEASVVNVTFKFVNTDKSIIQDAVNQSGSNNSEFANMFKAYYICYKIKSLRSTEVDELFSSSELLESFEEQANKIFNQCVEGAQTALEKTKKRLEMLAKISDKLEYLVTENPGDFKKTIMRMLSAPVGSEYTYGKR